MRLLVQHHPARPELLERLLVSLAHPAEVIVDPEPDAKLRSPWRTYRACMEALGVDAGIVLQDDAVACPGFDEAACAAVRARPSRLIAFFHGGTPAVTSAFAHARLRGQQFTEIVGNSWVPTVALYWPPGEAAAFLGYLETRQRALPRYWRADDGIVAEWVRKKRKGALLTVPCLVQHPDDHPSLINAHHRAGRNRIRVAAEYVEDGAAAWVADLHLPAEGL